jgi:hypothetical protein
MWNRIACAALGALCLAGCATGPGEVPRAGANAWHGSIGIGYGTGRGGPSCLTQPTRPNFDVTASQSDLALRQMDAAQAAACETPIP